MHGHVAVMYRHITHSTKLIQYIQKFQKKHKKI